jgi:uncharacterized protein (DUF934 family)
MSSQLIINNSIVDDEWQLVMPPKADEEVKKQAGKVVMFKLTGEGSLTNEQIENTIFSKNGKVLLPLISVRVKKFADGRIFSIGNLLRLKYKYKNELRAIGDVLRDQLFFLKRSGFNSFHIREDRDAKDALLGLNDFTTPYQGAVDQKQPAWKIIKR